MIIRHFHLTGCCQPGCFGLRAHNVLDTHQLHMWDLWWKELDAKVTLALAISTDPSEVKPHTDLGNSLVIRPNDFPLQDVAIFLMLRNDEVQQLSEASLGGNGVYSL